ncbi:MAG: hypothetical protein AAGB19_08985, partial [Cyanobacteria bacterium P01_F01_bin.3]
RPETDSQHLWLRSAAIVCFIVMMRLLQQQAETRDPELFRPFVFDPASFASISLRQINKADSPY